MNPFRLEAGLADRNRGGSASPVNIRNLGQSSQESSEMVNELARRLDRINVEMMDSENSNTTDCYYLLNENQTVDQLQPLLTQNATINRVNNSRSLIVTNVDPALFGDIEMRTEFESLFRRFDRNPGFTYLRSFNRVRVDFGNQRFADRARINLNNNQFYGGRIQCFPLKICDLQNIYKKTQNDSNNQEDHAMDDLADQNNSHIPTQQTQTFLTIPKLTKQFLISPPASPPVGWEPVHEGSPIIDVQLISAIANLMPGKMHEIHQGNESQPGIFVEVCDDAEFGSDMNEEMNDSSRSYSKSIPKTMSPDSFRQHNRMNELMHE